MKHKQTYITQSRSVALYVCSGNSAILALLAMTISVNEQLSFPSKGMNDSGSEKKGSRKLLVIFLNNFS